MILRASSLIVQDVLAQQDVPAAAPVAQPDTVATFLEAPATTVGDGIARALGLPAFGSGIIITVVSIVAIFFFAWTAIKFIDRITASWLSRYNARPVLDPSRQRAATLSNLFSSAIRYIAWPMAIIMSLSELGLDVGALIATAGVAGLAVGFGAQTLVRDVISGIFLLFDDSIHIGDLIRVGDETGTVEFIGVRLIKIRKYNGELLMVPSGELRMFANGSIGFARAIVVVGLAYEQDLEAILPVVHDIADKWAAENAEFMLEPKPTVHAITELGDSQVSIRIVIQVTPGQQFELERVLRRAIKKEFDSRGIEIPFPRRTIYIKRDADEATGIEAPTPDSSII